MNILVLNYEYPPLGGGAAPVSRDISRQLAARGHQVTVVTMGYKDLPAEEMDEGVKIYRVKCWRSKMFSCMPWEQYTYLLSAFRFMKKHPELQNCQVCHTHFVIPTAQVARRVYKKYGIPYVITAHGSDVEGYNSKKYMKIMHFFLRPAWKRLVRDASCVISPSVFLEGLMKKAYDIPNKYLLLPNGLDLEKYGALQQQYDKKPILLLMGRMQKYKNMQIGLEAFARLKRDWATDEEKSAILRQWSIQILGDGPYRPQLEELVDSLGLKQQVQFCGWVENSSPVQLQAIGEASIYVTASNFENCPMSVLETAAAGCHVLVSDIPAHRQMIAEEDSFFAPEDAKELAGKLGDIILKGPGPGTHAVERFGWDEIGPRYEAVLREAVEHKAGST